MSWEPHRRAALASIALFAMGLTSCTDRRVDDARMACTVMLQALYRPTSENEPVKFELVSNTASDSQKFEFVWNQSQIANLTFQFSLAEIVGAERPQSGTYVAIIESGGAESQYICRGSLAKRTLHGVWVRQTSANGRTSETKVTKYVIDF